MGGTLVGLWSNVNEQWQAYLNRCGEAGESLTETIKLLADSSDD